MPAPRPLTDAELHALDEGELFAHLVACRDAGMAEQVTRATWFLLALAQDDIEHKLATKLPRHVASERVGEVMERLLRQPLRGTSRGEFHALLNRVVHGVRVDWLRKEHAQLQADRAAPRDLEGEPVDQGAEDPGFDVAEYGVIIDDVLARRSPEHRQAIVRYRFHGIPAKAVAEALGLSENNVHQIARRFTADCLGEVDP